MKFPTFRKKADISEQFERTKSLVENHFCLEERSITLISEEELGLGRLQYIWPAVSEMSKDPSKPITVLLSSFGGCIYTSFAVHDLLKGSPCHINVVVNGPAMSGGAIIACAADKLFMYENSYLMFHYGHVHTANTALDHIRDGQHTSNLVKKIAKIAANKAGCENNDEWFNKIAQDWYLDADTALELGIADCVLKLTDE